MKMKGSKQLHYDAGPNMTPLVDVVMVILIFMMLAGSFGTSEHFMATTTPMHDKGGPVAVRPDLHLPTSVNVLIRDDSGNFSIQGVNGVMSDPAMLRTQLQAKAAQLGDKDKLEVILRPANGSIPWYALIPLYDECLQGNFTKVAFAQIGG